MYILGIVVAIALFVWASADSRIRDGDIGAALSIFLALMLWYSSVADGVRRRDGVWSPHRLAHYFPGVLLVKAGQYKLAAIFLVVLGVLISWGAFEITVHERFTFGAWYGAFVVWVLSLMAGIFVKRKGIWHAAVTDRNEV